ncbi:hypothetical protein CR513_62720, partial [Mucuna pruriens]
MISQIQKVRAQMAMQRPRTRVGKISAQMLPKSTKLPRTNIRRDTIRIGIVLSSKVLQKGKDREYH